MLYFGGGFNGAALAAALAAASNARDGRFLPIWLASRNHVSALTLSSLFVQAAQRLGRPKWLIPMYRT
eukprot:6172065-Pleurochrysis_carterae.AAC.2